MQSVYSTASVDRAIREEFYPDKPAYRTSEVENGL